MSNPSQFYQSGDSDAIYAKNFLSSSFEIDPNADYMSFVDSLRMLDSVMGTVIVW